MAPENTQTPPPQPPEKEQVVYTTNPQQSSGQGNEIPEEYLTDEYLYPHDNNGGGKSAGGGGKKKFLLFGVIGIVIIFLVIMIIGFLGRGTQKNNTTLTYWGLWDDTPQITELIKEYQAQHPGVTINYVMMDGKDSYRQRLLARYEKNTGPDIFRYHNTWVPELSGILAPAPASIMTADQMAKVYYPVIAKNLVVNNNVVGLPLGIDGLVLVYNKKALSQAGVATAPTDWDSLIDTAKKLTVKNQQGQLEFSGIAMGTAENVEHFSDVIGGMFLQNGVQLSAIKGNQNAISVFDAYSAFAMPPNDTWNETMPNSLVAFANEKVAMIFVPYWQLEVIRHLNPDLDIGVAPFPKVRGGSEKGIASYWVEGVSAKSANKQVAWDFLRFLSSKESLEKLAALDKKSGRTMPSRPYPRIDMASMIVQDPYMGPVIQQAPNYDSMPLISRTYDGGSNGQGGLNDGLVAYLKDAVNSILYGGSSAAAVDTFAQGVEQIQQQFSK